MAPTDRPLDPDLRRRLEALLDEGRSLRKLAAELGVNYFVIHKGVRGKKVRPATERAIREAMERTFGGKAISALGELVQALRRELGEKRARKVEVAVRRMLLEEYKLEGRTPPRGLVDNAAPRVRRATRRPKKQSSA